MNQIYKSELPESLQALQDTLKKCQRQLELGRENELYAFAWYEERQSYAVEAARTVNTSESRDCGVVFRIMCNGIQYEAATNTLDEATLLAEAHALRNKVDDAHIRVEKRDFWPTTWQQELEQGLPEAVAQAIPAFSTESSRIHFAPDCQQDPTTLNTQSLMQLVQTYREKALALAEESHDDTGEASPIADIQLSARYRLTYNIFIDREKTMSQMLPVIVLAGGGVTTTGQSTRLVKGGLGTLELARFSDDELAQLAIVPQQLSTAEKLKPGRYKVITGPGLSGVIAHEAFGHTQEGDTWMKGRSIASRLHNEGTRVGNEHASIMNNPAVYTMEGQTAGSNGSYFFDHEGQLARPQMILDKGYLSTPMTDLSAAHALDVKRTANGKRESWRRPLMARQTNTYFTPGEQSLDELIAQVEEGYLAVHPHGGMEDPKGGSLTAGAAYFEEIKQGKLTGKKFIGPTGGHIELTDSVFDVLDQIEAKSSVSHTDKTPEIKLGGCGKYHKELVEAGVGGPYILWRSVNCG